MISKKLFCLITVLLIILSMLLVGCNSEKKSIETMQALEEAQKNKSEQSKDIATSITENMKKNTTQEITQMFENQEKAEEALNNNNLTFEQEMNNTIDNVSNVGNRILFKIVFVMSQNAGFGSFVCIAVGSTLAFLFRKNRLAFKAYIFLAVGGPILFLLSIYLPAFMLYLYK